MSRAVGSSLRSGAAYRFRFERAGYLTQIFNLAVKPYEARLLFDVALVPEAGVLSVASDTAGVTLLLDDAASYLAGGAERGYRGLPQLGAETRDLVLDPGEYRLTARHGALSRTVAVTVAAERTTKVQISLDRRSNELLVRQQP